MNNTIRNRARRWLLVALVVAVILRHPATAAHAAVDVWREFRADA